MEHVNSSAAIRQQQQQHQHNQLQQHHQEQQQQHEHQQQFCLRWHNHQTSLLSTLPVLLDQSQLTDVTISAEGRTLRAHRVVLSACSTFFLELFRALDVASHPVIVIPGASFAAIVALLTFMYSGEVNVYEEQIPILLNLAETLGIKGLADVQHNLHKSTKQRPGDCGEQTQRDEPATTPTPPPHFGSSSTQPTSVATHQLPFVPNPSVLHPLAAPLLSTKLPTPLESFFLKSLQFYPNLLPQPLNFSQTALNKTTELLAKYQQQCNLYMSAKEMLPSLSSDELMKGSNEEGYNAKRLCTAERTHTTALQQQQQQQQQQQKDKRIDKIVENLRCGSRTPCNENQNSSTTHQQHQHHQQQQNLLAPHLPQSSTKAKACSYAPALSPQMITRPPLYTVASSSQQSQQQQQQNLQHQQLQHHAYTPYITPEDHTKLQQHIDQYAASCSRDTAPASHRATPESVCIKTEANLLRPEKLPTPTSTPTPPTPTNPHAKAPSNSKLYATCFICHKQLSNQYNLRVHLETHQNVRYACNVCSHVSRSKDALRKHVSYRHPGAPSPCETEARRKRVIKGPLNSDATTTATIANPSTSTSAATIATATGAAAPTSPASGTATPTSPASGMTAAVPFPLGMLNNATAGSSAYGGGSMDSESQLATSTAAYMFLPKQFQFAVAAAAAAQQQQQLLQSIAGGTNSSSTSTTTATSMATTNDKSTSVAGNVNSNAVGVPPFDFGGNIADSGKSAEAAFAATTAEVSAAPAISTTTTTTAVADNPQYLNTVSIKREHDSPSLQQCSPVPSGAGNGSNNSLSEGSSPTLAP